MKFTQLHLPVAYWAFILIGVSDGAVGVLLPTMRGFYRVDKATIGFLFLAGTFGYLLASLNYGLFIEKLGNQRFLMAGTGVIILGSASISLKPPFLLLLAAVMLIGCGNAALDAGLNAYVAALPRNVRLLNYLHAFYGLGALLGPTFASLLMVASWQWNSIYRVWASMGLVALGGFWLAFEGQSAVAKRGDKQQQGNVLALTLHQRAVWIGAFFLLFYVGSEVSLGSWSYSLLTEERHLPTLFSGLAVSGYWLGLTAGRLALASVSGRVDSRQLIQWCLAGLAAGVALIWIAPNEGIAAAGLWVAGFSLGPIFPTTIALMATLVSTRLLPSAIGFITSLGSMGAALFPWLAGNLAQGVGLWTLLPYIVALSAVLLALWLALRKQPAVIFSQEV